ncbi:type II secretion system ATPase GspE [Kordiimonas marina]|uniref:type II secretion system ATPase GspE n=1 Tax=Kordiimonas marina TaxID=2872312 RepID=UPI001FF110A8|nr:type II secretion system ATPase GspE [Kordiimonas marina]MCJ9430046.1 type II secretion system ATPase GspE [Kordiimonas marina]
MTVGLSYKFAKDNGLVVLDLGDSARIGHLAEVKMTALVEARRTLARPLVLEQLERGDFDRHLSEIYALAAMSSREVAEDFDRQDSIDSLLEDIPETADLLASHNSAPAIRFVNGLIAEAVKLRGSDIHIEPFETTLSIRLRIDGVLQEIHSLPIKLAAMLASRIKVMARLDIAEKRVPQDGRISLSIGGRYVDIRVSLLPSQHGERVVLRLLDREQTHYDISDLGMPPAMLVHFNEALLQPNGIILVTGPTGSGKTTTLYAGLSSLNDRKRNILTIEDPVEYALEGVGQTQVNAKVGMSFAAGLRAILRQDPDTVMVGEVRDHETAEIAVQASLTGHLVLTTVHTNSALGAITRLCNMGIPPFLLASSVKAILAQRLVRTLCHHCKAPATPDSRTRTLLGLAANDDAHVCKPVGCPHCRGSGYLGRIGVYDLVVVDGRLRQMIHDSASEQDMARHAYAHADTLERSGLKLVAAGLTTLEEVLRVCTFSEGDADADL